MRQRSFTQAIIICRAQSSSLISAAYSAESARQTCQSRSGKASYLPQILRKLSFHTFPPASLMSSIVLPFRLSSIFRQLRPLHRNHRALLSTSTPRHIPSQSPTVPITPQCPPSSCSCAAMPSGLAIDHEKPLSATMPPYAQHVVIRTGKNDWSSKIEDDPEMGEGVNFARELKRLVGRGGRLHDVGICAMLLDL